MSAPPVQPQKAAGPSRGAVSTPNKTPSSQHFTGGLVTIFVGPPKIRKKYRIHKDLLAFYSDHFRAAFNGSFAEAKKKEMKLYEVDNDTFEHLHTWLYTRKLVYEDENDKPLGWSDLTRLWVLGDYLQMPMLQNCVMDEIFGKVVRENGVPRHMAKIAYEKTMKGSLLRRASIELLAYYTSLRDSAGGTMGDDRRQEFTFDILHDLVKELNTARQNVVRLGATPNRDKCFFHVHGKDEHC